MSTHLDYLPVKSDIDDFLSVEKPMFDTEISDAFQLLNIPQHLKSASIIKRCGHSPLRLLYELFMIPFLMVSTVHLFVRHQFEDAADHVTDHAPSNKNPFYRFLETAKFNWRRLTLNTSFETYRQIRQASSKTDDFEEVYVLDDTVNEVTGKSVELVSYIHDHTQGKSVLGFNNVMLGIFNGQQFLPISERVAVGKKRPKAKSKATKYKKTPKADLIDPQSPGAIERKETSLSKLDHAKRMVKKAIRKGFLAKTILFDSWYAFNCFIIAMAGLNLDVICQLKHMPKANRYRYRGKSYSLKGLYTFAAKPKMRMVKKYQFKQAVVTVDLPNSDVRLKIVFILNNGQDKWHAFAATNVRLSAKKILATYARRWSIEVFFKNAKQYLNYGKEQVSNFDSRIASNAIVMLRYMILTYLASKTKSSFYEKVCGLRKQKLTECFGIRLLTYFLDRLKALIHHALLLMERGQVDQAKTLLKSLAEYDSASPQLNPV